VVVGALVAALAVTVSILIGPDDRVQTGPHRFTTDGAAVATAPEAVRWTGVTVEVTAVARGRTVFVGVAHDVDVSDYLQDTAYTRVDSIDIPWSATTTEVSGNRDLPAAPEDLDSWLVSRAARDEATVRFPLPDAAVDVVVMDADGEPDFSTEVTVSVVEGGVFAEAIAMLVVGLGIVAAGVLLVRNAPRSGHRQRPRRRLRSSPAPLHRRQPEQPAERS
jgi:hypothetical protein